MRSFLCLRVIATRCCRLLQTLVQTDWLRRSIEVTVPDFQVVLPRRLLRVAHPAADDMCRKLLFELRLPTRTTVLEEPRNLISDASSRQQTVHLRPEVGILMQVPKDQVRAVRSNLLSSHEVDLQLGKQRDHSLCLATVLCLR